jgi:hypothetical protein
MKRFMSRRTAYAGTIVALLMVGTGFVLAASNVIGPFTNAPVVKGNQGTVSTAGTIYASGLSGSLFWVSSDGSAGSCTSPTYAAGSPATVQQATGWVVGGPGACSGVSDYVMQLQFLSPNTLTAGTTYTDTFIISSEFNGTSSYTTGSVTFACTPAVGQDACEAVINVDSGFAATGQQPSVNNMDITVTGS